MGSDEAYGNGLAAETRVGHVAVPDQSGLTVGSYSAWKPAQHEASMLDACPCRPDGDVVGQGRAREFDERSAQESPVPFLGNLLRIPRAEHHASGL